MRKAFLMIFAGLIILLMGYFAIGYLSSYVGWYGYKKWQYRISTSDIRESKKRGVFVTELRYKIDTMPISLEHFTPYLEKGFTYGYRSSEETLPLNNTDYPYQLSFEIKSSDKFGLFINKDQLLKFDSFGNVRGYLKKPRLTDTIVVNLIGDKIKPISISVWQ